MKPFAVVEGVTPYEVRAEAFLRAKSAASKSIATLESYRYVLLGVNTLPFMRDRGIADVGAITADTLREFTLFLRDHRQLSAATIDQHLRTIKAWLRWCDDEGFEVGAGALKHRRPPVREVEPQRLRDEEITAVLEACSNDRDRFLVEFMLGTGLRLAEVACVRLTDFEEHPEGLLLRVRSRSQGGGAKGDKARIVPITRTLAKRLSRYIRDSRPRVTTPSELFLTRPAGPAAQRQRPAGGQPVPLSAEGIAQVFKRLRLELTRRGTPVPALHPHAMRHTFASKAIDSGQVDVLSLKRVMGHANLRTTERYVHFSTSSLLRAWQRLDG